MIKNLSIDDKTYFYKLGELLNSNFSKLYSLDYLLNLSYTHLIGYYENDRLVAFIHIEKHFEVIDIVNIVVDSEYRKCHIATKLINYVIKNYDSNKLILEVREDNIPAINLYEGLGFVKINVREKYYDGCDAIIMEKVI